MKNFIRLTLTLLIVVCVLIPLCGAADGYAAASPEQLSGAIVLTSNEICTSSTCSHSNTQVQIGALVGENCTHDIYNYRLWCNLCEKYITQGTIAVPKDTPEHTMRWITISCVNGVHTYEKRCNVCGYASESFSRPCNGPPCLEQWSLIP